MVNVRFSTPQTLTPNTRGSLEGIQNQTSSLWLYHKINSLLLPYGEGDIEYVEPVFLPSTEKTIKNRKSRNLVTESTFKLYPNPATDYVELHWNWFHEGLDSKLTVQIFSITGNLVEQFAIHDFAKNVWLIKTDSYTSGLYLINVQNAEGKSIYNSKLSIVK